MKMLKNSFLRPFCLTILSLLLVSCASGEEKTFNIKSNYLKAEHMIPMRDGVNLYTQVYTPRDKDHIPPLIKARNIRSCFFEHLIPSDTIRKIRTGKH
jgi:predicted acyl esterase